MVTRSEDCVRRDVCVQRGEGLIHIKELTNPEQLRGHGKLFNHLVIDPGCSIGPHPHGPDAELYYILEGELEGKENDQVVTLCPGDVMFTSFGDVHSVRNVTDKPAKMLAMVLKPVE